MLRFFSNAPTDTSPKFDMPVTFCIGKKEWKTLPKHSNGAEHLPFPQVLFPNCYSMVCGCPKKSAEYFSLLRLKLPRSVRFMLPEEMLLFT